MFFERHFCIYFIVVLVVSFSHKYVFANLYIHYHCVTQCYCNSDSLQFLSIFAKKIDSLQENHSCEIIANKLLLGWEFKWKVSCSGAFVHTSNIGKKIETENACDVSRCNLMGVHLFICVHWIKGWLKKLKL